MVCALLRDGSLSLIDENDGLTKLTFEKYPDAISNALGSLFHCEISEYKSIDSISIESWKCVSLADLVLYSLLNMLSAINHDEMTIRQLIHHLIATLGHQETATRISSFKSELNQYHISTPIVFLLLQMLKDNKYKSVFIALDGHLFIANRLKAVILKSLENEQSIWTTDTSFTTLQNQLHSMNSHILGVSNGSHSSNTTPEKTSKTTDNRRECLQNFAPKCSITSSSLMVQSHNLQSLISASVSQRRARTPQFTYNFRPDQEWLDITLTLPYPVMLKEIIIKPHLSSLVSSPSAVQAEVNSDPLGIHWSTIQYPQQINFHAHYY